MLHPLVRWLGRRCLRWFYRDRCVIGLEHLPATGPVLLIGNHPNDLPDILLGYLSTPRPIRYIGTISGAASPIARATYRGLGVIPVTRVRDARKQRELGVDAAATNEAAFQSVSAALTAGAMVAVFPEGGVTDEPTLGQFRGGVSKMALHCIDNGSNIDVRIVPIGVHYDGARSPRTDITVVIGAPFSLRDWVNSDNASSAHVPESGHRANTLRAIALRNRMHEALFSVTRNARSWEIAERRDQLAALIGALDRGQTSPLAAAAHVQRACAQLLHSTPDRAAEPHPGAKPAESEPECLAREHIVELANALSGAASRAGARPVSPRDCARVLAAAGVRDVSPAWPSMVVTVMSAPLALAGLALHAPVHVGIWRYAHRIAADRAELVARAFVPGIYLVVLWYVVLGGALTVILPRLGASAWFALPAVMLMPRLGDLGVWWRDAVSAWRLRARIARWPAPEREKVVATADALRVAWAESASRYLR